MAAELAQVHDVEAHVLEACCDNILDLGQNRAHVAALQHVLLYPDVEAPDADPSDLGSPSNMSKLSSIGDWVGAIGGWCTEPIAAGSHACEGLKAYVCTYMHILVYADMYMCIYIYIYTCQYVYVNLYVYVYMCV